MMEPKTTEVMEKARGRWKWPVVVSVLSWACTAAMATALVLVCRHERMQDSFMGSVGNSIMSMGGLAIDQDKRIDGIDSVLLDILRCETNLMARLDALEKRVQAVEAAKGGGFWFEPMPQPWWSPTNGVFTNWGIMSNEFFYVTIPCGVDTRAWK